MSASHQQKLPVSLSELRSGYAKALVVDGRDIALSRQGDTVYAVRNVCPHQLFRKLHEGHVADGAVTCPMHGWTFDLATGSSRTGQGRIVTYPVTVKGDGIYVELNSEPWG